MASQEGRTAEVIQELWDNLPEIVQLRTDGGINVNETPFFNKISAADQKKFSDIIDTILDLDRGVAHITEENNLSKPIHESTR